MTAPYPPLPPCAFYDYCDFFTAEQMRAYVDADRALREQAQPERTPDTDTEAESIIQAITDPENQPSQFGTVPMPTEDTVRLILDAFDNIELRKPLAREIRRILGVAST